MDEFKNFQLQSQNNFKGIYPLYRAAFCFSIYLQNYILYKSFMLRMPLFDYTNKIISKIFERILKEFSSKFY